MAHGDQPRSPWIFDTGEDSQGRSIRIAINYDIASRALLSANVHRDAGCAWTTILIGIGPDGTPNSTPTQFNFSGVAGDITVTAAQMLQMGGVATIDDINALGQVTAI